MRMKASDLRNLDNGRLQTRLGEIDQELFNLRFQQVSGRLSNTARFGQLRREVAQIKTILRERQLAQQAGS